MNAFPEYAHLMVGESIFVAGKAYVHMGNGQFREADPLAKRFDITDHEPLHRPMVA